MIQCGVRLPEELKKSIEEIAKIEKRSFNSLINLILEDFADNHLADSRLKTNKRISVNLEDLWFQ